MSISACAPSRKSEILSAAIKPPPFPLRPDLIPSALRDLPRWLLWRWERKPKDKRWSKVPSRVDEPHRRASVSDPAHRWSFADAMDAYQRGAADGIGYVLCEGDGIAAVDLDDCRDPDTGALSPDAERILSLLDSYTEVSPTGTGVKIYLRGRKSIEKCKYDGGVEVYDHAHYLVVTGHHVEGTPTDLVDGQGGLDALLTDLSGTPTNPAAPVPQPRRAARSSSASVEDRAIRYLATIPSAISGQRGHDQTFVAARAMVWGFDLGVERGYEILSAEYNPRCVPPWSDADLRRKCEQADTTPYDKPRGHLRDEPLPDRPPLGWDGAATPGVRRSPPAEPQVIEADDDPHRLARLYLADHRLPEGDTIRWWREEWFRWRDGAYHRVLEKELRAELSAICKRHFDECNRRDVKKWEADGSKGSPPTARKVTARLTGDVAHSLAGLVRVPGSVEQPAWLDDDAGHPTANGILPCRNVLIHLPSWAEGREYASPPSPSLFSCNALPYDYRDEDAVPHQWLTFLQQVWPTDHEAIACLQEWFGYCLLPDTSQQKILLLVGPRRSGKGTIARVLTQLIGPGNTCGPTLGSLGTQFGLQPLLGKTLALISDARLSHRTDSAVVLERLLSISGEDAITVERKYMTSVTAKLPLRFAILTNELPRLSDSSGALAGRLIILRMTESFYGREDTTLSARLAEELPGILRWSMEGWRRLHERGHFASPASSEGLVTQMEDLASPVGAFARECCQVGPGYSVPIPELYAAWRRWCDERGREPSNQLTFGRDLRAAVPAINDRQVRMGGLRVRVYEGIALLDGGEISSRDTPF